MRKNTRKRSYTKKNSQKASKRNLRKYRRNPIMCPISDLPVELTPGDVIEEAYRREDESSDSGARKLPPIIDIYEKLIRGTSVLVECDKELSGFIYEALRNLSFERRDRPGETFHLPIPEERRNRATPRSPNRFKFITERPTAGPSPADLAAARARIADGSATEADRRLVREAESPPGGVFKLMMDNLKNAINEEGAVVVIPHLDLLATDDRGLLNDMTKEVILLLNNNPEAVLLGFKDPEINIPKPLKRLFVSEVTISGIKRSVLPKLLLQREAKKLGAEEFDPYALYKYVSGLNAIKFRKTIIQALSGEADYPPNDPELGERQLKRIYQKIRNLTTQELTIPDVSFKNIGGYEKTKMQIIKNILQPLRRRDNARTEEERKKYEQLIPRGILFEGPPGTGKTLFAKAIAKMIDATVIVVRGPELKDKWVGESESKMRDIFKKARASAPAIIIFDEIDSFATKRGGDSGSRGVESSMVNQLLAEMDGMGSKDELVFVVGTTNFAQSLDDALVREKRFSCKIQVPYPNKKERRAILDIHLKAYNLELSPEVIEHILEKTEGYVDAARGSRFTGASLDDIVQALKSIQVNAEEDDPESRAAEERWLTNPRSYYGHMGWNPNKHWRRNPDREITTADVDNLPIFRASTPVGGAGKVTWEEVGGYSGVKKQLQEDVVQPINDYQEALRRFQEGEASIEDVQELEKELPKGIIFEGPPGTGKSYFAKALATAIGARTIIIKGPQIMSKWVGNSAENVRRIWEDARRDSPTVLVFDEVDTIMAKRSAEAEDSGSQEHRATVGQILAEMDGFNRNELVFVVATTNLIAALDDAVVRTGRFTYQIEIPYPTRTDRREIFEIYNKNFKLNLTEDQINYLVSKTEGFTNPERGTRYTGDDIKNICKEFAKLLRRKKSGSKKVSLSKEDIDACRLIKSEFEMPKPTLEDELAIAIHESGHTLVSALLKDAAKPERVTMEGDEKAISQFYTQFEKRRDLRLTRNQVIAQIAVFLSGKMAEDLFTGQISTGIYDDLMKASEMARAMVEMYGMGSFKESLYRETPQGLSRRTISSEREQLIDEEVESILSEAQDVVRKILFANRDLLNPENENSMVSKLLKRRTLSSDEIKAIIARARRRMRRYY